MNTINPFNTPIVSARVRRIDQLSSPRCPRARQLSSPRCPGVRATNAHFDDAVERELNWRAFIKDPECPSTYKDVVFRQRDWERHRDGARWIRHLLSTFQSTVVRNVLPVIFTAAGFSFVLVVVAAHQGLHGLQATELLPASCSGVLRLLPPVPVMSMYLFTLTSFALSLLLAFRLNSSYSRWYDARKTLGRIQYKIGDLYRCALTMLNPSEASAVHKWSVMVMISLLCQLRKGAELVVEARGLITDAELRILGQQERKAGFCLTMLSHIMQIAATRGALDPIHHASMETLIRDLNESVGSCKTLLKTPVPLFYTRHISRFLLIWIFLVPFALLPVMGWGTPFSVALIAFLLLVIDEIGVQIEEPFQILPLEKLTAAIKIDCMELKYASSAAKNLLAEKA